MPWQCINCEATNQDQHTHCEACTVERLYTRAEIDEISKARLNHGDGRAGKRALLAIILGFLIIAGWIGSIEYRRTLNEPPQNTLDNPHNTKSSDAPLDTTRTADQNKNTGTQANRVQTNIQPAAEKSAASITSPNVLQYRSDYELAKSAVGGPAPEHHKAFAYLFAAAKRAIDDNQADNMLADIKNDQEGAFWRLSHGHAQWAILIEVLETKDKNKLNAPPHHKH